MWMKKCVDSGLWVAGPNDGAEEEEEEEDEAAVAAKADEAARKARELDPLD